MVRKLRNSNMKFCLNGALLMCTMDGSSIEIANEVGRENMYVLLNIMIPLIA